MHSCILAAMPYIRFRAAACVALSLFAVDLAPAQEPKPAYPSFDYEIVRAHEIKPHRGTIPLEGVDGGSHQFQLKLTISPEGNVLYAEVKYSTVGKDTGYWPQVEPEVDAWKFTPFEKDGKAVTAEVEEYVDLVPPERLPKKHVKSPEIRPNSTVSITLERSGCLGSCPSYKVTVATSGITFYGDWYVVAGGRHTDTVNPAEVRDLAQQFVNADFYSMDATYTAMVTDNPGYTLAITIDGLTKQVDDYVGSWVGMPSVITELEDEVDDFAGTKRWIKGSEGLVDALKSEKFNFKSYKAQVMLKEAAQRGQADTVQDLLDSGVPLKPYPVPKPKISTKPCRSSTSVGSTPPAAVLKLYRCSSMPEQASTTRATRTSHYSAPRRSARSTPSACSSTTALSPMLTSAKSGLRRRAAILLSRLRVGRRS